MNKYGISTDVMDTYVADFHGTTQVLFNDQSEDATFNKPVCYDCHGVHDIAPADDPEKGLLVQQNLLARCQDCHPDATENFPAAWLSHYIPSPENNQLVYFVDLFYKILIPVVIGGMALLVTMDFSRRSLNRYRARHGRLILKEEAPLTGEAPGTEQLSTVSDESVETAISQDAAGSAAVDGPPASPPESIPPEPAGSDSRD
jgi:hypothetical protein